MNKGERTRETILAEAMSLASVTGLDGLSIGALARHTGLSKSGLFAHFGSKKALQLEVLEAASAHFVVHVVAPARQAGRGAARLRASVEKWIEWSHHPRFKGGCPFVPAGIEWDDRDGPIRDYIVEALAKWQAFLARAAQQAIDDGEFRADIDPEQVAYDIYSIALGYHNAQRLMRNPKARRYAVTAFERLMNDARLRH